MVEDKTVEQPFDQPTENVVQPNLVYMTDDGREAALINMAYDYAEQQLASGSPPVYIVQHFLRAGSHAQKMIDQRHAADVEFTRRRILAMDNEDKAAVQYEELLRALRSYGGGPASGDVYATE